jgi:uncharacterized iron-regulated membrane protein
MGNPTAGVLMLLVGTMLLMMFVTGRLDWLTRLTQETKAVQQAAQGTTTTTAAAATTTTKGVQHPAVAAKVSQA